MSLNTKFGIVYQLPRYSYLLIEPLRGNVVCVTFCSLGELGTAFPANTMGSSLTYLDISCALRGKLITVSYTILPAAVTPYKHFSWETYLHHFAFQRLNSEQNLYV